MLVTDGYVHGQFHQACVGASHFARSCPSCQRPTVAEWGGKIAAPAAADATTNVVDLTSERPTAGAHNPNGPRDTEGQE